MSRYFEVDFCPYVPPNLYFCPDSALTLPRRSKRNDHRRQIQAFSTYATEDNSEHPVSG